MVFNIDQQQTPTPEKIHIIGHVWESQQPTQQRHEVQVTIIQGGKSINGYSYSEEVLRQIAAIMEGAHAYVDHARGDGEALSRSVRDMVGFYHDVQYVPPGAEGERGRVDGTLHIFESADWLWGIIEESCTLHRPDLIGLSIDIFGTWNKVGTVREVSSVVALNSCDIVTRPSAGGGFRRILHDKGGDLDTTLTPNSDIPETSSTPVPEMPGTEQLTRMLEEIRLEKAQLLLTRRLLEERLPEAVATPIRERYHGRLFEEAELERDLTSTRKMLAELASSGIIRDHGYQKPEIGQQITEAEKIQAAFDGMFDLEIDRARLGNIKGFTSIREAYARVTGDASVAGFHEHSTLGDIRVSESAPISRISEADTTTASFSYLLGTSMNKRLLKDYQTWPAEWNRFCTVTPLRDFKQQTRVRLGAFGSLSTVAEDTPYTTISLTDTAATYVPTKRGNLVTVSRETIINDDLFAIRQLPTKLAAAAAYTLAEFVYGFLSGNPNIYDGSALFTLGAPHNNLGAAALSTASMQTGVTTMREQTNFAGKRIGLRPRWLIVPPELEFTAMVVTKSAGVPGSANNDINPMLGYVTPIVSPQLTNTSQWFFAADPTIVDTIEIGFVGGQVNPALFIQDQPLYGLNFTQDVISYKIRHEYGGAVVDYRGLYRGI